MKFSEFAKTNLARCLRWHKGGIATWSVDRWVVAMTGEAGELAGAFADLTQLVLRTCEKAGGVANAAKKYNRAMDNMQQKVGPTTVAEAHRAVCMEIGDVGCYLDLLAQRMGTTLEDCLRDTFNRISEREGFPERCPNESVAWANAEHFLSSLYGIEDQPMYYTIIYGKDKERVASFLRCGLANDHMGTVGSTSIYDTGPN